MQEESKSKIKNKKDMQTVINYHSCKKNNCKHSANCEYRDRPYYTFSPLTHKDKWRLICCAYSLSYISMLFYSELILFVIYVISKL